MTQFFSETKSKIAKKILSDFDKELQNFIQICPIEMLDKLEHPISQKKAKSKLA